MVKKFFQKANLPWIVISILISFCSILYTINIAKIKNISRPRSVRLDNVAMYDQYGKMHEMYRYSDANAIVLIMHGVGCPIAQKSIPYINRMSREFKRKGVEIFYVNSSPQDSRKDISEESEEFGVDIPILKDHYQQVAKMVGAKRTMETVIIDPEDWSVIYHGAVSDRWDYGSTKTTSENEYAKRVLNSLLSGDLIDPPDSKVKGCLISFKTQKKN